MQHARLCSPLWLSIILPIALLTGCAESPFGAWQAANPWIRKKWEEDEKFGPTYHRRLASLRGLRGSTHSLAPDEKQRLTADLSELVRSEPNPILRIEAVHVLSELQQPEGLAALQAALSDQDKDVRIAACQARGTLKDGDSLAALAHVATTDTDIDVRLQALRELGKFRDPVAIQVLGKALDDTDPAIQFSAVQSLKETTGLDYGDSVPAWRDYVHGRQPSAPPAPSLVERMVSWF